MRELNNCKDRCDSTYNGQNVENEGSNLTFEFLHLAVGAGWFLEIWKTGGTSLQLRWAVSWRWGENDYRFGRIIISKERCLAGCRL